MNHTEPSECETTSLGAFSLKFLNESAITLIVPSCSVLVTRLVRCSQVISLPWVSRVFPLELFDGIRYSLTLFVSSDHRKIRLLGISLKSRYPPSPNQTGPSAHLQPVKILSMPALKITYFLKLSSIISTAGSGYVITSLFQSRSKFLGWSEGIWVLLNYQLI